MANTVTIDANRQELWSKDLLDDVMRDVTNVMKFVGEDENNIVQVKKELGSKGGDRENFTLIARLAGNGVTGDDELEGNEESMLSYNETLDIDQIRNAVRLKGKLDAQKVVYDQIKPARENLRIWMKEFLVRQFFLKLGGVTNTSLTDVNGKVVGTRALWSNTPDYIPDADENAGFGARYLCADFAAGTTSLATSDTMTLDLVTRLYTKAKLTDPQIQPLEIDGESMYVLFLHPLQARDIRLSSDWKTAQENAQRRGDKNPVFGAAIGVWSNVIILENEFVPWLDVSVAGNSFRGTGSGTDCANDCARAILCGRQAALMAECSNPEALVVEQFDYKNKDGVAGSFIGGVHKPLFNSKEFGVMVLDTYAGV